MVRAGVRVLDAEYRRAAESDADFRAPVDHGDDGDVPGGNQEDDVGNKQKLSIAALAALGIVGLSGRYANATEYSCASGSCPNVSTCNGDSYERNGCSIQCYTNAGGGEIKKSGNAGCS
jgi:hypothetical protein